MDIKSWDDVNTAMGQIRDLTADMDKISGKYSKRIAELEGKRATDLQPLKDEEEKLRLAVEDYVRQHRDELSDADGKSRKLAHGVVGFRFSNWSLDLLDGWSLEKVLERIKELKQKTFIRKKEEVDKREILKADLDARELKKLGMEKVRAENFFCTIKDAD